MILLTVLSSLQGYLPLHIALKLDTPNEAVVRLLLDRGGAGVERATNFGVTPLYWACDQGHLEVVRYLCSEGADVEAASDAGKTPLFAAVLQDQKAVVKCLVHEYGADVNHRSYNGRTPLFAALENDLEEMATFLVVEMKDRKPADQNHDRLYKTSLNLISHPHKKTHHPQRKRQIQQPSDSKATVQLP